MAGFRFFHKSYRIPVTGALAATVLFLLIPLLPAGELQTVLAATQQDEITASKQKISDNKKKMEEIQSQKYQVDAKLKELNQLKSDAAAYVARLDQELAEIEAEIGRLNDSISFVEEQIVITEAALEEARNEEARQYASMKLRIKYMYEHGNENIIDDLFRAGSFSDLLNQAEYIQNVSVYDRNKLEEYVEAREMVAAKEEELITEKELLEQTRAEAENKQASVSKLQQEKTNEVASYNAKIKAAESEAAEMQQSIAGIQAAIRAEENNIAAIEAEIRRQEEEARRKAEAEGRKFEPMTIGNISFTWPCPGQSRITSHFGDRESPTEGASTNHKGVDVGAPSGTPVVAAAGGTVVISQYSSSAGNYIMISHGGGVYTVYMHLSSLGVSKGTAVSRGDRIGAVGSTGYSTGPHLHFGIRINGGYVNPLNYVRP